MARRRSKRPSKRRRIARRVLRWGLAAFVLAWAAQLLAVTLRLDQPTWDDYWAMRGVYRPGLIAFRNVAEPWLPADYFAWHSKRGATAGFIFATGLYALPAIPIGMLSALRSARRKPRR